MLRALLSFLAESAQIAREIHVMLALFFPTKLTNYFCVYFQVAYFTTVSVLRL